MRVIIVANSPVKSFKKVYQPVNDDFIITCDNAVKIIDEYIVSLAIGDFDSGGKEYLDDKINRLIYPAEKDQTDLELALMYVSKLNNVSEILIFDANGGRSDHYLINLKLIAKYQNRYHIPIKMINETEEISYLSKGEYKIINNNYQYISLINFDTCNLTLEGFKYNLNNYYLPKDNTLTISNEIIGKEAKIIINLGESFLIKIKNGCL